MMAAPLMREGLTVELSTTLVSQPFVHMTASVMADFGAAAHVGERRVAVPRGAYRAVDYVVEPDASSASYFFALAAITGGRVTVAGLGADSRQGDLRFVRILEEMGADVVVGSGQVTVRGTGTLRGITADLVDMSDVVPTLAVVAAFADGSTQIEGVGFIRGKESDRIGDLAAELEKCGVDVEEREDGLVVRPGPLHSATIDPHGDHRLAMALTVLGLAGPGVTILDPTCVAKTFPGFFDAVARLARSPR
jgi:3-phosphoshikimate 1-carboxyvinyltransferase